MPVTIVNPKAVEEFRKSFAGQALLPGEAGYDEARMVHNGMIDKQPAIVARCAGTADIVDAVNLARRLDLEIAVRGGGHNVAGKATVEGGMMIDLSPMRAVKVDPKAHTAWVQGGARWGDLNRETQVHGLAVTGGVISSTGVGGLTLGGGLGWLMAKHGLALDNLLSVEVVTADGKVIIASAEEHADLFWALRGGGGNFGVAAAFEFKLHPVGPIVTGGLVVHPFGRAREVLRFFRDQCRDLPDEQVLFGVLAYAPDNSGERIAAIAGGHCGPLAEAEAAVKPLKAFGPPVMDAMGPIPYSALNGMLDIGNPKGALNYWKSSFLAELSDAAIDAMIACFERCPSPMASLGIEHLHGQVCRIDPAATAFPHRAEGYNFLVVGQWSDPADTARCIAWVRETYAAMAPFVAPGRYVNYLGDDETGDPVKAAYGANYARLQKIKAQYDPSNVFHLNQNIRPAR